MGDFITRRRAALRELARAVDLWQEVSRRRSPGRAPAGPPFTSEESDATLRVDEAIARYLAVVRSSETAAPDGRAG